MDVRPLAALFRSLIPGLIKSRLLFQSCQGKSATALLPLRLLAPVLTSSEAPYNVLETQRYQQGCTADTWKDANEKMSFKQVAFCLWEEKIRQR